MRMGDSGGGDGELGDTLPESGAFANDRPVLALSHGLGRRSETLGRRSETLGRRSETLGRRFETLGRRSETLGRAPGRSDVPETLGRAPELRRRAAA